MLSNIFTKIKSIAPNARTAKKMHTRSAKRDSLDVARSKTIRKLQDNKAYYLDSTLERPDLVYKESGDGTYVIGIKYGNRYLSNVCDGNSFVDQIDKAQVAAVLDLFVECVVNGDLDAEIEKIMLNNVLARKSTAH